jgi:hypothetical protein
MTPGAELEFEENCLAHDVRREAAALISNTQAMLT